MGIQVVSEKIRRRCEAVVGMPVDRVVINNADSGHHVLGARVITESGHEHWVVDRRTWTAHPDPDAMHWTSCRELAAEKVGT